MTTRSTLPGLASLSLRLVTFLVSLGWGHRVGHLYLLVSILSRVQNLSLCLYPSLSGWPFHMPRPLCFPLCLLSGLTTDGSVFFLLGDDPALVCLFACLFVWGHPQLRALLEVRDHSWRVLGDQLGCWGLNLMESQASKRSPCCTATLFSPPQLNVTSQIQILASATSSVPLTSHRPTFLSSLFDSSGGPPVPQAHAFAAQGSAGCHS